MGILGLSKLIADKAPGSVKEHDIKSYFGRKHQVFTYNTCKYNKCTHTIGIYFYANVFVAILGFFLQHKD